MYDEKTVFKREEFYLWKKKFSQLVEFLAVEKKHLEQKKVKTDIDIVTIFFLYKHKRSVFTFLFVPKLEKKGFLEAFRGSLIESQGQHRNKW